MIQTATATDSGLASLCATLHLAGVNKVMPWISPVVNIFPVAAQTAAFRNIATKLFKKRLARGRASAEKDVFFYLVRPSTTGQC